MSRISQNPAQHQDTPEWPVNRHAEEVVLGNALQNWAAVKERIGPDLFWDKDHRRILAAMLELDLRLEPVDRDTVLAEVERKGLQDGDLAALSQLEAVPVFEDP